MWMMSAFADDIGALGFVLLICVLVLPTCLCFYGDVEA